MKDSIAFKERSKCRATLSDREERAGRRLLSVNVVEGLRDTGPMSEENV